MVIILLVISLWRCTTSSMKSKYQCVSISRPSSFSFIDKIHCTIVNNNSSTLKFLHFGCCILRFQAVPQINIIVLRVHDILKFIYAKTKIKYNLNNIYKQSLNKNLLNQPNIIPISLIII